MSDPQADPQAAPHAANTHAAVHRLYGFRFSVRDGVALLLGAVATVALWPYIENLAFLPLVVLGHFFLFCNIFRLRRSYELIWATLFLINVGVHLWRFTTGEPFSWAWVLGLQAPVTLFFITLEVRSRDYHGIFSARLNPHLQDYIASRLSATPRNPAVPGTPPLQSPSNRS